MSILISVAHSSKSVGAVSAEGTLTEYLVSLRASLACFRSLSGEVPVELFDCGPLKSSDYDDAKLHRVNQCAPDLAIEIHCNAGPPGVQYHEIIYASPTSKAKAPAEFICNQLTVGLNAVRDMRSPSHGARVDDRGLFFLQKTKVPALIVEGLFISNPQHARWLAGTADGHDSGAEKYGVMVAMGIKAWLNSRNVA